MFSSSINDREIQKAVKMANWMLTDSEFYDELAQIENFSHTDRNGKEVGSLLYENRYNNIEVVLYSTWYPYRWPFPMVKGYYTHDEPNIIHVNKKSLPFSDEFDHVVNLFHEFFHSLKFTHKGNNKYKYNNINSVPYKAGYLAGAFAKRKWGNEQI